MMRPGKNNAPAATPHASASVSLDNLHRDAQWRGDNLMLYRRKIASVVPDRHWPGMWRVLLPNGYLSDMANRTRAKDAARSVALLELNEAA